MSDVNSFQDHDELFKFVDRLTNQITTLVETNNVSKSTMDEIHIEPVLDVSITPSSFEFVKSDTGCNIKSNILPPLMSNNHGFVVKRKPTYTPKKCKSTNNKTIQPSKRIYGKLRTP
jgi:hypothetical protein